MNALSLRLHANNADEAELIIAAQNGDEEARTWLIDRFTPSLYRFSLRMLGNEQDARDAAQDTMVKVLRNLHRYDSRWRFSTWAFSIARNTCIDEYRRRRWRSDKVVPDVADWRPDAQEQTDRKHKADRLHEALQQVPALYREVLVMYHFEHLKYQEIAQALDIPIGTVMNRIFRARHKLRAAYADGLSPEDLPT